MNPSMLGVGSAGAAADGLIFILTLLGGTYVTWNALAVLKWDKFVFDPLGQQTRVLRLVLALIGGFFIGCVAVGYMMAVQAIRTLF